LLELITPVIIFRHIKRSRRRYKRICYYLD